VEPTAAAGTIAERTWLWPDNAAGLVTTLDT
jgi:hypothetical protein